MSTDYTVWLYDTFCIGALVIAVVLVFGMCITKVETEKPRDPCTVVKYRVAEYPSVCAIECYWLEGGGSYSTTIPVTCDWFGKSVARSQETQ